MAKDAHGGQPDDDLKRKQELEIEKLEKEVRNLERPLMNPANWAPFATLVASSFALIWAICTGWFSRELSKLQYEKIELKKDIDTFEVRKANILNTINDIRKEKASLKDSFEYIKKYVSKAEGNIASLESQIRILERKVIDEASRKKIINSVKEITASNDLSKGICGVVIDSATGRAVVNAQVSIVVSMNDVFEPAYSDLTGGFIATPISKKIEEIFGNKILLEVTKDGWRTYRKVFLYSKLQTVPVVIRMTKNQ